RGAIYGLLAAAIWGGMYVVSDVVLKVIPPFTLLTIRLILGAVVLLVIRWRTANVPWPNRREVLRLVAVGFVGFGVSVGAQFVGTDLSTAINGALVTSASPAFILIFAALILHERLTMQRIAAVGLATVGVLLIIDLSQADFGSDTFVGNLVLALAALTWGLYSVLVRKVSIPSDGGEPQTDTLTVTLVAFMGGLLLTIPSALLELPKRPIDDIDAGVVLGVLYLGVVSTAGAMWLWNRSFALVDASVASLFFFAQPLVGAVLSVALLGQQMTLNLWLGGLLIGGAVLLSLYPLERLRARRLARHDAGDMA
ncbi:MAG: DMT family transporter, partial [Burkholderiales bacterium]|nr:DMT family transporter [Anaerolineae bacterium]